MFQNVIFELCVNGTRPNKKHVKNNLIFNNILFRFTIPLIILNYVEQP